MSTIHVIQTMIEITLALIVIWCFIHEDRLIAFEDRLAKRLDRWQKDLRRRFVAWGDRYWGIPKTSKRIKTNIRTGGRDSNGNLRLSKSDM